jgi:hypothetical protein
MEKKVIENNNSMKTFQDDLNTAVITTKYVLNENSPILYVNHYEDGFWEFLGKEDKLNDEDFKLVSLEEIIVIDSTILEVADLPYEKKAYRDNKDSFWVIL